MECVGVIDQFHKRASLQPEAEKQAPSEAGRENPKQQPPHDQEAQAMTTTTHPASMSTEQRDQARRAQFTGHITDVIHGVGDAFAIYHYTNTAGKLCAIAFYGKAIKPAFRYSFRSLELRNEYSNDWASGVMRAQERIAERRAQRNQPHALSVGDVLMSMWGYEQTNVDYYEVTAHHGRTQVTLRRIAARSEATGGMQGDCTPVPGKFTGEPIRCKVDGSSNTVRLSSFQRASKIEPIATVDGLRVWPVDHWTAYA